MVRTPFFFFIKSLINLFLSFIKKLFCSILKAEIQEQYQTEVFILDSHISYPLNSRTPPKDLVAWFTYCPIDVRLIIFPYCSRYVSHSFQLIHLILSIYNKNNYFFFLIFSDHWSVAIIDIKEKHALYFNSLVDTTHLNIKR